MINFSRAFDSGWERMMVILFRPFNFGKWCVIGFSAFLAGLLQGGNGFNSSFNFPNTPNQNHNNQNHTFWQAPVPGVPAHGVVRFVSQGADGIWNHLAGMPLVQSLPSFNPMQATSKIAAGLAGLQAGMLILIAVATVIVVFAIILVMYWLGSRGQFLFLDNIVRNRGEIGWPWTTYAKQGNSLFLFYLLFLMVSFAVIVPIIIVAVVMCIPLFTQHRWPGGGEIAVFVLLGIIYFVVAIAMSVILFIFREFGVPIMFRQGLMARAAFMETMGLVKEHTGSVALFVLLRIAIFIGVAIISVIACCMTCCIAMLPYIGTVILLPVLVFVRCFSLDCLAQFGPRYDVFTVDVPPGGEPSFSPPPPLG